MCMTDDGEPTTFWSETRRQARKNHRCYECGRDIVRGEKYLEVCYMAYGEGWYRNRRCQHCEVGVQWLNNECGGYLSGGVQQDLQDHWDHSLQPPRLGRILVGMRRSWKNFKGTGLMPVPSLANT